MRIWPMMRWEVVQSLVDATGASDYLEIGIQSSACFHRVAVENKTGVDPDEWAHGEATKWCNSRPRHQGLYLFQSTSDDYFRDHESTFDVIFIDGLHERGQWKTDVENAISRLRPGGAIVCHDCLPPTEKSQIIPLNATNADEWVGDVWKGWVDLRQSLGVMMMVVDTDYGVGVIVPDEAAPTITVNEPLEYRSLLANKDEWLNLVSVERFKEWVARLSLPGGNRLPRERQRQEGREA